MRKDPDIAYAFTPSEDDIPEPVRAEIASPSERAERFAVRISVNVDQQVKADVKQAAREGSTAVDPCVVPDGSKVDCEPPQPANKKVAAPTNAQRLKPEAIIARSSSQQSSPAPLGSLSCFCDSSNVMPAFASLPSYIRRGGAKFHRSSQIARSEAASALAFWGCANTQRPLAQ